MLGIRNAFARVCIKQAQKTYDNVLTDKDIKMEILLNAQRDVRAAQEVIAQLKDQIAYLQGQVTEEELKNDANKAEIKTMKESLDILKRAAKDMNIFSSAFEEGINSAV